ncbi:MAG: hypothetical protein GQ569_04960, partial [Methylococcaceae bacterium]|nr:hypothetical protein [Methylococcaceae bacterium]
QASQLRDSLTEIQALERIQNENQALNSDPVAQYELKEYLTNTQQQEEQLLSNLLEHPELNDWFRIGKKIQLDNRRHLQTHLSQILEQVYSAAPLIKNELINRDKPSPQANSARKKLATLMLSHAHLEDLGFEKDKFPPEKSIYKALFKETGIHRKRKGLWTICEPLDNDYNMQKVWRGIDVYIKKQASIVKLADLYAHLQQPPYGIKAGVLPLLFIAYYLANQRRLALYEEGIFCPQMTLEHFEILLKRPDLFSLEVFAMQGVQANLFNHYLETLLDKTPEEGSLLDIIKSLAKFIHGLPEYTAHTKNLDKQTLAVRDAFAKTQSPIQLLFEHLPQACGFAAFSEIDLVNGMQPDDFMNTLVQHLKQLKQAYPALLALFQQQLTAALGLDESLNLAELRQMIQARFSGLEKYSHDRDGLQAFIKRLQNNKETDEAWLESIGALLGKVPTKKWRAEQQAQAEYRLIQLSERLLELEKLHAHQLTVAPESKTEVKLIRLISQQQEPISQPVYIDDESQQKITQFLSDWNPKLQRLNKAERLGLIAQMLTVEQE